MTFYRSVLSYTCFLSFLLSTCSFLTFKFQNGKCPFSFLAPTDLTAVLFAVCVICHLTALGSLGYHSWSWRDVSAEKKLAVLPSLLMNDSS